MSNEDTACNFFDDNKIYIYGLFDETLNPINKHLRNLISELKNKKNASIEIYISSDGGRSEELYKLLDLINIAKNNDIIVKTISTGYNVASCGSCLAVVGTKGYRYIGANTEHLVHYGRIGSITKTIIEQDRENDRAKRFFNWTLKHYDEYCEIPNLKEKLATDGLCFTAKECIKYKLADKYITELEV